MEIKRKLVTSVFLVILMYSSDLLTVHSITRFNVILCMQITFDINKVSRLLVEREPCHFITSAKLMITVSFFS